jgi:hypothetical protein
MTGSKMLGFLAIALTALSLMPSGAHFFELPNKIGLAQEPYFTVQGIYRGWALFGITLFAALAADLLLAIALRRQKVAFALAVAAFLLIALSLVFFFLWVYPANQATANWTVAPPNWETLRAQWEWTHALNALLMFVSFLAVTLASLTARE